MSLSCGSTLVKELRMEFQWFCLNLTATYYVIRNQWQVLWILDLANNDNAILRTSSDYFPIEASTKRAENVRDREWKRRIRKWRAKEGLKNLLHVCPKWHTERFPWYKAFTAVPIFVCLLSDHRLHIVHSMCVHIYTYLCTDCSLYELPLLPNDNVVKYFYTNRSVKRIFIVGAPAWRWPGENVTLDGTL